MSDNTDRLACDFTAIPQEERDTHKEVANSVFEAIQETQELDDGYAFRLPSETKMVEQAGSFIARERLCCPFFQFELAVDPKDSGFWLKLKGDKSVKNFIEESVLQT